MAADVNGHEIQVMLPEPCKKRPAGRIRPAYLPFREGLALLLQLGLISPALGVLCLPVLTRIMSRLQNPKQTPFALLALLLLFQPPELIL